MSDEEILDEIIDVDLEAKEHKLRLLNEKLDQRRERIVERAEALLNQQKNFLKTCVEDNVQQLQQDCDTDSDSNVEDIADCVDILKLDESKSDLQANDHDLDELPRTQIPQKLQRSSQKETFRKLDESKTPDMDTPNNEHQHDTPNINDLEMESEILNGTTIGKDAELRLQRARYKALERNFANIAEIANEKEKEINDKNKKIKELQTKLKKYDKEKENLNKKINGEKKESLDLIKKCKRLEHELYSIKTDFKEFKKESKVQNDSMRNSHIRLNRALEDAEKYKNLLAKHRNENKNSHQIYNKDLVHLKNENRALIKQKNELLSAFKKQLKLIDILKKQKIHLESAKVLQFTEQQFIKTLDIGQTMNIHKK
eukprot:130849_1